MKKILTIVLLFMIVLSLSACKRDRGNNTKNDDSPGKNMIIEFGTYIISDSEIGISSYIGERTKSELVIPQYIDGKKVVAIGDSAFANNFNDEATITSITIPSSVRVIGKHAFFNNKNITNITFEEGSQLTTIEERAFANLPNVTQFTLPSKVNYIGEGAFAKSGIVSFNIIENPDYLWQNNFLINKNVSGSESYIAIYVNPKVSELVVPTGVKLLSPSLFEDNQNIYSIDLNELEYIGDHAFANSSLITLSGGNNIHSMGEDVFLNTRWLENQRTQFVTLGSVLIKYLGEETEVVIPEGITRIGERSFDNQMIETIILPSTLTSIGIEAFTSCKNLSGIQFNSTQPPILDGVVFNSHVILYVKETSYNYYMQSLFYKNISNQIHKITINDPS